MFLKSAEAPVISVSEAALIPPGDGHTNTLHVYVFQNPRLAWKGQFKFVLSVLMYTLKGLINLYAWNFRNR